MDEATASIDEMTDRLIQNMIKKELTDVFMSLKINSWSSLFSYFLKTTVITIAHRLKTIIQYDKILVLDLGNLKELDTPLNLLDDNTGYFHKLVMAHGNDFFKEMKTLAQNKELDVYWDNYIWLLLMFIFVL